MDAVIIDQTKQELTQIILQTKKGILITKKLKIKTPFAILFKLKSETKQLENNVVCQCICKQIIEHKKYGDTFVKRCKEVGKHIERIIKEKGQVYEMVLTNVEEKFIKEETLYRLLKKIPQNRDIIRNYVKSNNSATNWKDEQLIFYTRVCKKCPRLKQCPYHKYDTLCAINEEIYKIIEKVQRCIKNRRVPSCSKCLRYEWCVDRIQFDDQSNYEPLVEKYGKSIFDKAKKKGDK